MKKIDENTRVTLTVGELKKLVNESTDTDDAEPSELYLFPTKNRPGCDVKGTPLHPGDWVWIISSGPWDGILMVASVVSVNKMIRVKYKYYNSYNELITRVINRETYQVLKIDNPEALVKMI